MPVKHWIERALNIQPGDLGRGTLLSSSLFLILSSYSIGRVARDALFLSHFKAVQLPYVDIACALLVGGVVAVYLNIGRRVSLQGLLIGSQLFFALNCAVFWILVRYYHFPWLLPVFYVWVGIFGVLAPAQIWTLANYTLTTREAKRIYGMVGGGAIAGATFAGFICKTATKAFGTESWDCDVAEGREDEFEFAVANSEVVMEYEELDEEVVGRQLPHEAS